MVDFTPIMQLYSVFWVLCCSVQLEPHSNTHARAFIVYKPLPLRHQRGSWYKLYSYRSRNLRCIVVYCRCHHIVVATAHYSAVVACRCLRDVSRIDCRPLYIVSRSLSSTFFHPSGRGTVMSIVSSDNMHCISLAILSRLRRVSFPCSRHNLPFCVDQPTNQSINQSSLLSMHILLL